MMYSAPGSEPVSGGFAFCIRLTFCKTDAADVPVRVYQPRSKKASVETAVE